MPVNVKARRKEIKVERDEEPHSLDLERLGQLRPAFSPDGTITAANASSINDGAALLVLTSRQMCEKHGVQPIAKVLGHASYAHEPKYFTTAPVNSIRGVLRKVNLSPTDIDLYEINEAFSVVPMYAMSQLSLSHDVVNVHGGAVALGHPIGASGARILVTLIHALQEQGGKRGLASICIGGGEASSLVVELCS